MTLKKAKRTCELCTENEVTHKCLNCDQNICQSCTKIHLRSKATADHTVGTLEDIRAGNVTIPDEENEYRCNKHKGEVNRFYCETCHVLICRDCTDVDHCNSEHQYTERALASSKYRNISRESCPRQIENLQQCLKETSEAQQFFQKNVSHMKQEVKKRADQMRAEMQKEEDQVLGEIRTLEEGGNTTFDGHIKTMQSLLQKTQHMLTIATDLVTTDGKDGAFLSLLSNNRDLFLSRSYVPPQIDANLHYLRLGHQSPLPGSIRLGEVHRGDTKWELRREVGRDWAEGFNFDSVSGVAALQGNKIAVTATGQRLVIFNPDGGFERTIPTDGSLYHIAAYNNHIAVVDDTKRIKVYNEDFKLACQILPELPPQGRNKNKVNHRCVCFKKDGSILVGHDSRKLVTLHRPDGPLIRTIPVETTPRFLATDSNGRVIVSGHCDNQVTVMDDQGVTLVTIKPTIDGQAFSCCSGVCCDGSDIYVAVSNCDSRSGHIHRYGGDGKFLSCIVQGLHDPKGITFTEDGQHLAVADRTVKIYKRV